MNATITTAVRRGAPASRCSGPRPRGADCNDPFGKPNELLDFHLQMSRADWNGLVANRPGEACNAVYRDFPAQFRCGSEGPWLKVAVRKKRGEERGAEAPAKPPLKIDINEDFMGTVPEAKGQNWPASQGKLGFRKLTLNNGQGNKPAGRLFMLPLLMTEHVAMRLLKREVAISPGTAYAKVTLHTETKPDGQHIGVYVLLEDIDRGALRRRFGLDNGRLVKNSKDSCPVEVQFDDGPPNAAKAAFDAWFPAGRRQPGRAARKAIDLDAFLRQEAIREILVNGDDAIATSQTSSGEGLNFFYFDPKQGPRQYMPWDIDLTFGQQNENCAPNNLKCAPTDKIGRWCGATRRGWAGDGLPARGPQTLSRDHVPADQRLAGGLRDPQDLGGGLQHGQGAVPLEKDMVWGGMDPSSPAIDKSFGAEYIRLKSWIPARIASVQQQINCAPGCPAGKTEACSYLSCAGERRCENSLWTTCQPAAECGVVGGPAAPTPDAGAPTDAARRRPAAPAAPAGRWGRWRGAAAGGSAGAAPRPLPVTPPGSWAWNGTARAVPCGGPAPGAPGGAGGAGGPSPAPAPGGGPRQPPSPAGGSQGWLPLRAGRGLGSGECSSCCLPRLALIARAAAASVPPGADGPPRGRGPRPPRDPGGPGRGRLWGAWCMCGDRGGGS